MASVGKVPMRAVWALVVAAAVSFALAPALAEAGEVWKNPKKYGTFLVWYAPSFYTGTAPRTQDPDRLHIHLARGNQTRITMAMDEEIVNNYLEDLVIRTDILQELIDKNIIELTQNMSWERLQERLKKADVKGKFAQKGSMSPEDYFQLSIDTMKELEPGRVFHISLDVDKLLTDWSAKVKAAGSVSSMSEAQKLALVNELIPTRLWITKLTPAMASALDKAAASSGEQAKAAAGELLKLAAGGTYPVKDGKIDYYEYTTVYPTGTVQQFTNHNGKKIPFFPQTGVWTFIPRMQGKGLLGMVDYISTNPGYGYITMLPYQHAGGRYYNAYHNDGVRIPVGKSWLPKEWKNVKTERAPHKKTQNLWLNSRGPVSHGCSRIPSELMGEFRNIVPSSGETLKKLKHFRNLPHLYDVFDVDGDGTPEVVGLKYYMAYKMAEPRDPIGIRCQNTREDYYNWMYGNEMKFETDGSVTFPTVSDARFVGRKAFDGKTYKNLKLFEPEYPGDKLQFYLLKPVNYQTNKGTEFNRELRKVGFGHKTDRAALFLQ